MIVVNPRNHNMWKMPFSGYGLGFFYLWSVTFFWVQLDEVQLWNLIELEKFFIKLGRWYCRPLTTSATMTSDFAADDFSQLSGDLWTQPRPLSIYLPTVTFLLPDWLNTSLLAYNKASPRDGLRYTSSCIVVLINSLWPALWLTQLPLQATLLLATLQSSSLATPDWSLPVLFVFCLCFSRISRSS